MRTRLAAVVTAIAVFGGGTGVVLARGGTPKPDKVHSAAKSQYHPGKGCGDKNHEHERNGECTK